MVNGAFLNPKSPFQKSVLDCSDMYLMVGNNEWVKLTVLDISKKMFFWLKWGKWIVFGLRININFFLNLFISLILKIDQAFMSG